MSAKLDETEVDPELKKFERRNTMTHDYEFAFNHFRPDYLNKGQKNPARYTITGCYTNGEYFRVYAENRAEIEEWLNKIRENCIVEPASIAIMNRFGQLLLNSETGAEKDSPKFMNGTVKDSAECFCTSFWKDSSKF